MAQRRFDSRRTPTGTEPPTGGRVRATVGMAWRDMLRQRRATANDNRIPPWKAAIGTGIVAALALAMIYAAFG